MKRVLKDEVEFITIMLFDDIQSVIEFAGEHYEKCYVPEKVRKILSGFDDLSRHYEIIDEIIY